MSGKTVALLCWIGLLGGLAACAGVSQTMTGELVGHVTIGPLLPVERADVPTPTPAPEVYAAWQVLIYAADRSRLVARLALDAQGNYQVALPPGSYIVEMEGQGLNRGANLPQVVLITAAQTTRLDLSVDTGIR